MENLPGPFKVILPEIYQVEVSAVCDHSCEVCPRNHYTRKDKTPFFSLDLLTKMIRRGDFKGSYFVELQMSGEPLLNKSIRPIINLLKSEGLLVGLSTHGDLFPEKIKLCSELDYITISVDSITKRNEARPRLKGRPWKDREFMRNLLDSILFLCERNISIDLQFIEVGEWKVEKDILFEILDGIHLMDKVNIRSVPDCSILHREDRKMMYNESLDKGVCLNPWLSISVQSNGNVVPCCFAWGDNIIYGNLNEQSLEEIWNGDRVESLRNCHKKGPSELPRLCNMCYMRSPTLLHWQIYMDSLKNKGRKK
jgi:radical SAM protein with 4Fe4S-binding SPASM domain